MGGAQASTQRSQTASRSDGGEPWGFHVRYAPSDFVTLLWRERFLMLWTFAILFLVGLIVALTLRTTYPARASVLISLGQEYVYEPRAGDAARGAIPELDQVTQSEAEILGSDSVRLRVVERLGVPVMAPSQAARYARALPAEKAEMASKLAQSVSRGLKIETAPGNPVVRLTYENRDPQLAARVLNALVEEYLIQRRTVLIDRTTPVLAEQRKSFEERLADVDAAYETFLTTNNIGDFEAERAALNQLQQSLQQQKYANEASLRQKQGQLAGLSAQLGQINPEVGLYRDINNKAADQLVEAKARREDLLSRYRPDSQPVQAVNAQIAQLEQAVAGGRAQGEGTKRLGVNPVFQTLQTESIQARAEVEALQQATATVDAQIAQVTQRQLRLAALEPQFQNLSREREVLQSNVRDFTVKEEESQAAQAMAQKSNDNIRIAQRAVTPTEGKSLKKPVFVLAVLFAAFTALCVGLLRMFLRPGVPTPAAAARTLDLPVLAMARLKA